MKRGIDLDQRGKTRSFLLVSIGGPPSIHRSLTSSLDLLSRYPPPKKKQAVEPLISLARSGASSPQTLARSVGLGFAIGLCPAVGAPVLILICVLAASRLLLRKRSLFFSSIISLPPPPALNAPALLVGNAISLPAELLMLGPYLRAGRALREAFASGGGGGKQGGGGAAAGTGAGTATASGAASAALAAAKDHARRSLPAALFVWLLSVPLVCWGVAALLEPWLARAVSIGGSSAPPPHSSSSSSAAANRAATADVELAPLVSEGAATTTTTQTM